MPSGMNGGRNDMESMTKEKHLSENQISSLTLGKKHWTEKAQHCIKALRSYGFDANEQNIQYFMEVFIPSEERLHRHIRAERRKTENQDYVKVTDPKIGGKYHLSWANRGCVWVLIEFLPNGKCKLRTPKTKRIFIANVNDLYHLKRVQT